MRMQVMLGRCCPGWALCRRRRGGPLSASLVACLLIWHLQGDPEAAKKFQEVQRAYDTLRDPQKRQVRLQPCCSVLCCAPG